jgi:hypothetical protein
LAIDCAEAPLDVRREAVRPHRNIALVALYRFVCRKRPRSGFRAGFIGALGSQSFRGAGGCRGEGRERRHVRGELHGGCRNFT